MWDAIEVVEFTRKHTANVRDGLNEVRRVIERLAGKRDARRDAFVNVVRKAMNVKLGSDAEEVAKRLGQEGFPRGMIKEALEIAQQQGAFTIFALVDALTRLSRKVQLAGDRMELDSKIGQRLSLALVA